MRILERNESPIATSFVITAIAIPLEFGLALLTGADLVRAASLMGTLFYAGISLAAWAWLAEERWTRVAYLTRFVTCWAAWNLISFACAHR